MRHWYIRNATPRPWRKRPFGPRLRPLSVAPATIGRMRELFDDSEGVGHWADDALCASEQYGELFLHMLTNEMRSPDYDARVGRACAACPVLKQCDDYATSHPGVGGIWAGLRRD